MDKFIPYAKLSKKKKRELDAARRETWSLNPVTRAPANPKAYNRKKAQKWRDDSISVPLSFLIFDAVMRRGLLQTWGATIRDIPPWWDGWGRTYTVRVQPL